MQAKKYRFNAEGNERSKLIYDDSYFSFSYFLHKLYEGNCDEWHPYAIGEDPCRHLKDTHLGLESFPRIFFFLLKGIFPQLFQYIFLASCHPCAPFPSSHEPFSILSSLLNNICSVNSQTIAKSLLSSPSWEVLNPPTLKQHHLFALHVVF